MNNNKFDDYINAHPRESLTMVFIVICLIWQTIGALIGILIYVLVLRKDKKLWWVISLIAVGLLMLSVYLSYLNIAQFIKNGVYYNVQFFKHILGGDYKASWTIFYDQLFSYLLCVPFFVSAGLSLIDLIPVTAHADTLKALQQGKLQEDNPELSEKEISAALKKIKTESAEGTVLGVSTYTGLPVIIPDKYINQVMLVLGTTGSGKTITLRRFYHRAIQQGYPLIIIDGKPANDNIDWLVGLAKKHQRPFYGFNCEAHNHYDPLANGGHTELKDKIISLKDQWENDYYRSIAEDYLQTTFEVLLMSKENLDLKKVVECLNYDELHNLVRKLKNPVLSARVSSLENYKRDDITGLQAHLNILIHSELGEFFERNHSTFTLSQVIAEGGIVYFALPALRFPSFSKVLGKLIINDLKAVVDRLHDQREKIFTVFDEFSVFAGEQVLNLVNMGRGKGVHAIFGTQGLADLDKVDKTFKSQVLNCVNTLICHRLNDQESAESIASWVGTQDKFDVTGQVNLKENDVTTGSVRVNKGFIVHPDGIKQRLRTGEAFYVSKVQYFQKEKLKVKFL